MCIGHEEPLYDATQAFNAQRRHDERSDALKQARSDAEREKNRANGLEDDNRRLREALEPFVKLAERFEKKAAKFQAPVYDEDRVVVEYPWTEFRSVIRVADLRAALAPAVAPPKVCPGGRGCTCCGPMCDCGCRDNCPEWGRAQPASESAGERMYNPEHIEKVLDIACGESAGEGRDAD